jgi:hypothetical protein
MSTNGKHEYKMIRPSTNWFGVIDREKTAKRLNHLAREGWMLDQVSFNWWSFGTDLILRRSR